MANHPVVAQQRNHDLDLSSREFFSSLLERDGQFSLFLEKTSIRKPGYEFFVRPIVLQLVCFWSAKSQIRKIVCASTRDWYLVVNVGSHKFQLRTGIKTTTVLIFEQLLPSLQIKIYASSSGAASS
jgi:hypothetical protein